MPEQVSLNSVEIEHVGNVTIVRFVDRLILTGTTAEAVSDELSRLLEAARRLRLILNFDNVQSLTSLMLGKLIRFNKNVQARHGRLVVCGLNPDIKQIFDVTRLSEFLEIHGNEQDALQALHASSEE